MSKLIPDFDSLDGFVEVSVSGRERPHGAIRSRGPYLIFNDTEYVCPDVRVRQLAIEIDSNDLGSDWRMGTWRPYATVVGRKAR